MGLEHNVKKAGNIISDILPEEKEYTCEEHGIYKAYPMKFGNHEYTPTCPKCAEEAKKRDEIEKLKRQEERQKAAEEEKQKRRIARLEDLNIGKRLWDESFETFNAYTEELKHHLNICIDFANDHRGRKLVMLGNNGTGKNHLAASILKITGGVIHVVSEINDMLRQSYSRNGGTQEYEIKQRLCKTELLVIDEIGRTKGGRWEENWMSYIINKRHENLMPTILISNKHLKEDCPAEKGCPDCLQNWVGNDILSRIIEDGLIMEFTGEDYRMKIREKRVGKNGQ